MVWLRPRWTPRRRACPRDRQGTRVADQGVVEMLNERQFSKKPTAHIFDMDGTLADVSGIRHHVSGGNRDFHTFHMESAGVPPHQEVVDAAREAHEAGHHVAIVTARKAKYRNPTAMWLALNGVPSDSMHMRADKDNRPDYDVKQDIHRELNSQFDIVHAHDDNPNVIRLWKEKGIDTTVVPGWED